MKTSQNIQRLNFETFFRSNQDTCLSQRPLVKQGQWIGKGQLLADCINSVSGDLSLGKNVLVAYMPWEGYNFEDSIVISDRLIAEDIYTSIHILRFRTEIVDNLGTKSPSINSKFSLGGEASESKTFSSPASKVPNFLRKPLLFHKTTHSIFLPPVSYAFLPLVSESDRMQSCAYVPVPRRGTPYVPPTLPPSLPPSGVRVRVIAEGERVQVNEGVKGKRSSVPLCLPPTLPPLGVRVRKGKEGVLMQRIKCKDHPISLKAKLREFSSSKRKVIAKSKKVSDFCPPLPVPRRGTELRFPFAPSFTPYLKGVLSFAFPVTFGDNIGS